MLNAVFFTFNPFEENTYLLFNHQKQCWIIDPGMYGSDEITRLTDYISEKQLQPQAIINTHTHIDHILGAQALIDKYKTPFGIHKKEIPLLNAAPASAMLFGFNLKQAPQPTFFIEEGKPLLLGEDTLEVYFTPGHSPGSISFYYPKGNWVIAGDVLFEGSIGRTDLPGGDFDTLISSIRTQLFTLPDDTTVFPGHGNSTRIIDEKKHNPFLNS